MSTGNEKCCGNCSSAVRAAAKNMSGFIWCISGHASRRSGISSVQGCFVSPKRAPCTAFKMRSSPLQEAPAHLTGKKEQGSTAPESTQTTIPPWDMKSTDIDLASSSAATAGQEANNDLLFI